MGDLGALPPVAGLVLPFGGHVPRIAPDVFLAPGAAVIGDVEIGDGSSVWYGTVVRGDVGRIRIGRRTNLQDGTVVHLTVNFSHTIIGDDVLVGHRAVIHGCILEDGAFVGMGATVMDHAVVEGGAMVAAGALVPPNKRVPRGQLWAGSPASYKRDLTPDDLRAMTAGCTHYARLAQEHRRAVSAWRAGGG